MSLTPPCLSIVVPVHNEASFLPAAIDRLLEAANGLAMEFRVIVVENGSTDGTGSVAAEVAGRRPQISVLELERADYGAALREGFLFATEADWVVAFDIDYFSRDFLNDVLRLADDVDVVLASKRDPRTEDRRPLMRRVGTRVFNLLLRTLFSSKITDTHGMKALRYAVVAELGPRVRSTQDLFDTELLLRAERAGYRIAEVPAVVEELRQARSSFVKRVPRTIWGMLRLRRLLRREAQAG